jgi:MoxR-like ATPase
LNFEQFQSVMDTAVAGIRKVMIGQEEPIRYSLVAVLCNQHALIEGVPGLGKTLLARTLAAVLGSEFKRIQFTPDLMPADITGTNVFNLQRNEFSLIKDNMGWSGAGKTTTPDRP